MVETFQLVVVISRTSTRLPEVLGLEHKRHGNPLLWRNGVMPACAVLAIDELRQLMEGVL